MTSFTSDPDRFRAFEQSGWEKAAARYHDTFRSLTTQAVDPLLDAVGAGPGVRLLDMATGPGYVAAEAARRGARVVGMDLAAAMVVQARRHHPNVHFQVGDAERLPFAAKSFDAVVMSFGLLHVARPEVALSEAFRVLRSGGRVGFTVWMPPEQTVGFGMILRAIESHGNLNTPLPEGPPFFRFSDPQECCRVLREAGFIEPNVAQVPQLWRLPSADDGDRAGGLFGHLLRHRAQQELCGPASAAAPYHDQVALHLLGEAEDLLRRVTETNDALAGDARLVERRARRSEMTLDLFLEQLPSRQAFLGRDPVCPLDRQDAHYAHLCQRVAVMFDNVLDRLIAPRRAIDRDQHPRARLHAGSRPRRGQRRAGTAQVAAVLHDEENGRHGTEDGAHQQPGEGIPAPSVGPEGAQRSEDEVEREPQHKEEDVRHCSPPRNKGVGATREQQLPEQTADLSAAPSASLL